MITDAELDALLKNDAARRAQAAAAATPETISPEAIAHARALGLRLMGGFVREATPVVDRLRSQISAHGYNLSPLHPARSGALGLQIDLVGGGTQFAPLLFALDKKTGAVRVFVQQFGGRQAPDFMERQAAVEAAVDAVWLESLLRDYVACMLRPRNAA